MSNRQFNFIDLFAGAGGLSEGFARQGFLPLAHVEADAHACATLRTRLAHDYLKNSKNLSPYYSYLKSELSRDSFWSTIPQSILDTVIHAEISNLTIHSIFIEIDRLIGSEKVDLVIGGPPCQAYSLVGRSRDPNRMRHDNRNYLFRHYAAFLERYRPEVFVFENVLGLLSAGNSRYFDEMQQLFGEAGYGVDFKILNAQDYGVLQKRRRVFIIGKKNACSFEFPYLDKKPSTARVYNDLFRDLPHLVPGQEMDVAYYKQSTNSYLTDSLIRNGLNFTTQHVTRNHNERDLEIYSIAIKKWKDGRVRLKYADLPPRLRTHRNIHGFEDRYKVVDPDGHSHTVVAHIAKDGHHYIFPSSEQIRSISVREAARLQSFPDNYYFEGGRTAAFRQIGNAVPPLMAGAIAEIARNLINDTYTS